MADPDVDKILKKYSRKIESEISGFDSKVQSSQQISGDSSGQDSFEGSREYLQFKKDMMPDLSRYEKWAQSLGNILKLKLAQKDEVKIQKRLNTAHLSVSPSQVVTLAVVSLLLSFFTGVLLSIGIFFITKSFPFLFLFLIFIASLFLFYYTYS